MWGVVRSCSSEFSNSIFMLVVLQSGIWVGGGVMIVTFCLVIFPMRFASVMSLSASVEGLAVVLRRSFVPSIIKYLLFGLMSESGVCSRCFMV